MVTKTQLKRISLKNIVPNPFMYPDGVTKADLDPEKIEWLKRSWEEMGQITSPQARKIGAVYELVFGHHRNWVADLLGETHMTLEVGEFDDEYMMNGGANENDEAGGADEDHYVRVWRMRERDLERKGKLDSLSDSARKTAIAKAAKMWDGRQLTRHGKTAVNLVELDLPEAVFVGVGQENAERITVTAKKAVKAAAASAASGVMTDKEAEAVSKAVVTATKQQLKLVGSGEQTQAGAVSEIKKAAANATPTHREKRRGRPIQYGKLANAAILGAEAATKKLDKAYDKKFFEKLRFAQELSDYEHIKRAALALELHIEKAERLLAKVRESSEPKIKQQTKKASGGKVYTLSR